MEPEAAASSMEAGHSEWPVLASLTLVSLSLFAGPFALPPV